MRILYIGQLTPGGTALQRARALEDLGHKLTLVDSTEPFAGARGLASRAVRKLSGHALDFAGTNRKALAAAKETKFDVVWVDKSLAVRPQTLRELRRRLPRGLFVAYSPDDMAGAHNQSPRYLAALPLYDLHITTKSFNVPELRALGARQVLFVDNAYDPATHRPRDLSVKERDEFGADVTFVGTYEDARARLIHELARHGIPVQVWGCGWKKNRYPHVDVRWRGQPVYGDAYARVICATRINLCFLRKLNRDRQTTRSVEIPACGGFMLAERTDEHERLFAEGVEAEYFSGADELIRKCRYYLEHEQARAEIARKGRARCLRDGYSNQERLSLVMNSLARMRT